jgi:dTDP-4-amino-4,6-dideoxygalactose transaminase
MGNVDMPEFGGEPLWPNNYCLGEVECALGAHLLKRLDTINSHKRKRALEFIDALADCEDLEFHRDGTSRHNYHLLVARVRNGKRNSFIRKMAFEKGIQCVVQYCPLNRYPLYQKSGFGEATCPNADEFFDNMVSFPFHSWLNDGEIEYMITSARDVLHSVK